MSFIYRLMLKRMGLVATHKVRIRRNIRVRMPDGIELLTDIYLGSSEARAPAIMIRSPYGKGAFIAGSTAFPLASQGFNVVLQCCRGTHGSGGVFDPHHDEQRDGLATLDWVKQQSWCNGVLATHGGSYLGYTQWAVAASAGPEVKAMAMQITLSDFSSMTYSGNSLMLQNAFSWSHTMISAKKPFAFIRMLLLRLRGVPAIGQEQWKFLPLANMDEQAAGERIPFWKDWMQHARSEDPWWATAGHHKTIPQVKRPITMLAGWFDIFTPWQLKDFSALREASCDTRITIGPWQHTDAEAVGVGLKDAIEWFNLHLFGRAGTTRKAVRLFVIGANEWREFDNWPPREASVERWHLHPQRQLRREAAPESPVDSYVYDPSNPTPSVGGPALESTPYSVDNTTLEARDDVLTFTTDAFAQPGDIVGTVMAHIYMSSSAVSADIFVRLCDVDASGVSKNICDGLQRIRVEPGVIQRVAVALWPTAYRVAEGHRLRVQISSGAFPRWARNLGTDEPLSEGTRLVAATQSIHHSGTYPSVVIIPFCASAG